MEDCGECDSVILSANSFYAKMKSIASSESGGGCTRWWGGRNEIQAREFSEKAARVEEEVDLKNWG